MVDIKHEVTLRQNERRNWLVDINETPVCFLSDQKEAEKFVANVRKALEKPSLDGYPTMNLSGLPQGFALEINGVPVHEHRWFGDANEQMRRLTDAFSVAVEKAQREQPEPGKPSSHTTTVGPDGYGRLVVSLNNQNLLHYSDQAPAEDYAALVKRAADTPTPPGQTPVTVEADENKGFHISLNGVHLDIMPHKEQTDTIEQRLLDGLSAGEKKVMTEPRKPKSPEPS